MRVAALVRDRADRARLTAALRGQATVQFYDCPADLVGAAADDCVDTVLVEPRDARGTPTGPAVATLRACYPDVTIVGYCDPAASGARDVSAFAQAGVTDFVFRRFDDDHIVLPVVLADATHGRLVSRVLSALTADLAPETRAIVAYALGHGREATSVATMATALGVDRKTLVNRLRRAGLPPPRELLMWSRLLLAASLLAAPERSVEQTAFQLHLPSAAALRNAFRRYTGLTPAVVRQGGGLSAVLPLFRNALQAGARPLAHASPNVRVDALPAGPRAAASTDPLP